MNEVEIKNIEQVVKPILFDAFEEQKRAGVMFAVDFKSVLKTITQTVIIPFLVSNAANLTSPSVKDYFNNLSIVQEDEDIAISKDKAAEMAVTAYNNFYGRNVTKEEFLLLFEENK